MIYKAINSRKIARGLLFSFLLFNTITLPLQVSLQAQEWQNPANKYSKAYDAYQNISCPIPNKAEDHKIAHFAYFARDRQAVREHAFLQNHHFTGAQIMYPWSVLEPNKSQYDFSTIDEDLTYLKRYGKKLFIQLQDTTFFPRNKAVPAYMLTAEYDGGVIEQWQDENKTVAGGWVAKRWNTKVQQRFALLLFALGQHLGQNPNFIGINLQETAIDIKQKEDSSFTPERYIIAIKNNMKNLAKAFPSKTKLQYANFTPGEWLPWEDKGHLRSIYNYGESIGVGLGAPDLMPHRKGQLNHTIAMMHEGVNGGKSYTVPLAIAVQDGNYIGQTGNYDAAKDGITATNPVAKLYAFAKDFMGVRYMFWSVQQPYFGNYVMPCFTAVNLDSILFIESLCFYR